MGEDQISIDTDWPISRGELLIKVGEEIVWRETNDVVWRYVSDGMNRDFSFLVDAVKKSLENQDHR